MEMRLGRFELLEDAHEGVVLDAGLVHPFQTCLRGASHEDLIRVGGLVAVTYGEDGLWEVSVTGSEVLMGMWCLPRAPSSEC